MVKRHKVFYSFHYKKDVRRVAQIRNIGSIEGNSPVSSNAWEELRNNGDEAIMKWIDKNMKNSSCLIVLIGEDTSKRKWVKYEIRHAYKEHKGLLGIYIHNIKDPQEVKKGNSGKCKQGNNPFELFTLKDGRKLSSIVTCYNPNSEDAYNDIKNNIEKLIDNSIEKMNEFYESQE